MNQSGRKSQTAERHQTLSPLSELTPSPPQQKKKKVARSEKCGTILDREPRKKTDSQPIYGKALWHSCYKAV